NSGRKGFPLSTRLRALDAVDGGVLQTHAARRNACISCTSLELTPALGNCLDVVFGPRAFISYGTAPTMVPNVHRPYVSKFDKFRHYFVQARPQLPFDELRRLLIVLRALRPLSKGRL